LYEKLLWLFCRFLCIRWIIRTKDIVQRSFSTCVRTTGHRFCSDRKSGCSHRVTCPYRISKQVQSRVVLAQQTLVRWREGGRNVSKEKPLACVPTSRISEHYVVDLLLHELNPFRFRYRTSREIPLDVSISPLCLLVSREIYAPLLPVCTQLCILIGARGLFCPVASSIEELKVFPA